MTPSGIFLYFCLSFIGGALLNSLVSIFQPSALGFLICAVFLIFVFWKNQKLVFAGFCVVFLVLGIWRHQTAELRIMNNELRRFNDNGNIVLVGVIAAEPKITEKIQKLIVEAEQITFENFSESGPPKKIKGKILIAATNYPEYHYGDKLKITGFLESPGISEGFNYRDYLAKDGIFSTMNWPKIELLGSGFGNPVMEALFRFKNRIKQIAREFVPPPQEGILEALFFGDENNISRQWKDKLNFTGTRHIAAVSGMNITIISGLFMSFLLLLGFWRQQAFWLSIILLILYILMIGAPASAARAGIMAGLLITAQYFGRASLASRAIVFAAAFMLVQNPLLIRLDVGFQLSFLAVLGMIELQPFFSSKFKKIPNPKIFPLGTILSTTLAAQVFTLPILIFNFGYIPLVSLPANILIVPFLAPVTILIFIFGLAGIIFSPLGHILSLPVWLSLTYIVVVIDWFSRIPFASVFLKNVHWSGLAVFYLLLIGVVWKIKQKERLKFLEY